MPIKSIRVFVECGINCDAVAGGDGQSLSRDIGAGQPPAGLKIKHICSRVIILAIRELYAVFNAVWGAWLLTCAYWRGRRLRDATGTIRQYLRWLALSFFKMAESKPVFNQAIRGWLYGVHHPKNIQAVDVDGLSGVCRIPDLGDQPVGRVIDAGRGGKILM